MEDNIQKQFHEKFKFYLYSHASIYLKYLALKKSKNDLRRGIALATTTNRTISTQTIRKSLNISYRLTNNEDVKFAIKIIDQFINDPLITIQMLEFTTNKDLINSIKDEFNFDIEKYLIEKLDSKYTVLKKMKIFLNSAHPFQEIHIENSLQLYIAKLYSDYFKDATNEQINDYVNEQSELIVNQMNLDIEPPNYSLGRIENKDIKIKTLFKGVSLIEINPKNDRKTYTEDEEYQNILLDAEKFNKNPKEYLQNLFDSIL